MTEVNENETERVLKFFRLSFAYEQPRTGFVFVEAENEDQAAEHIFEAVPPELQNSFRITGTEEVDEDEVLQPSIINPSNDTVH